MHMCVCVWEGCLCAFACAFLIAPPITFISTLRDFAAGAPFTTNEAVSLTNHFLGLGVMKRRAPPLALTPP